ncbi:MAG: DUF4350 domain-containing protein [Chloroflexi bacterium]|nr:DUF4350 domain-containing protein [Chloroflexota bacterium]
MNRRLALFGGLFVLLFAMLVLVSPDNREQPRLTVYSAQPTGGKALRLWLEALGHTVSTIEAEPYRVPGNANVVVVLAPRSSLDGAVVAELERFVRRGGRLVVHATFETAPLLRSFSLALRPVADIVRVVPANGAGLDPRIEPMSLPATATARAFDLTRTSGRLTPLLYGEREEASPAGGRPVLAARVTAGRGEVIAITVPDLFSNEGLRTPDHARLALSLIGPSGQGQTVAFDELHHGFGQTRSGGLFRFVFAYTWGRAVFWAGVVLLVFLLWRGRRLGRSVPVFVDRGRSLGELVSSQAALYRAGRKRAWVAEHLARQVRHQLTQAVGLPADATDEELATRARQLGRDPGRALRVLAGVRNARSDRQLVTLTHEARGARAELTAREARPTGP